MFETLNGKEWIYQMVMEWLKQINKLTVFEPMMHTTIVRNKKL